jgi:hypothetical protein
MEAQVGGIMLAADSTALPPNPPVPQTGWS